MRDKEEISTDPDESPRTGTSTDAGTRSADKTAIFPRPLPDPPSDEEVARIAAKLGAPIPS